MIKHRFFSRLPQLAMIAAIAAALFGYTLAELDQTNRGSLSFALVIQENATSGVASDIKTYREFIRRLPQGTKVMVALARSGSLRVLQPFTKDLEAAAAAVRPPSGLANLAPGSPYQSLKEALKLFPEDTVLPKRILFVGDGLDLYGPRGTSPSGNPILETAVKLAQARNVEIDSIFAPTTTTLHRRGLLIEGQSALGYVADKTGGQAFFLGSTYLSAKPYLDKIQTELAMLATPVHP